MGSKKLLGITNTFEFHNDICKHMEPQGNLFKRVVYAYMFYDDNGNNHSVYVGLTCNINKRNYEHIKSKLYSSVRNFINEHPNFKYEHKILTNGFVPVDIAAKLEGDYIQKFKDEGWNILNVAKSGALGRTVTITNDVLKEIISKYTYMADFMKNEKSSYMMLLNRGIVDELTKNLKRKKHTDDDLIRTAIECGSLSNFLKKYKNTKYPSAYRKRLIPKIREMFNVVQN